MLIPERSSSSPAWMVTKRQEKCSIYERVFENNSVYSLYRVGEGDFIQTHLCKMAVS